MKKTVLITGATRGIGKSTAKKFASCGYNVIINYKNSDDLAKSLKNELEEKYNINAYTYKCDVSSEEEINVLINKVKKDIGSIDVLVNNAGISLDNALENKDAKEFMEVIKNNLLSTFLMSKYIKKVMNKGAIINVSSTNGIDTNYIESIDYDASKAGVISLTHNFAKEYAPYIRVNAIAVGWVDTDMNKDILPEFKKSEQEKILLERFALPEEIANVIYFLASDDASYINDTVIRIDGGLK